MINHTFNNTYLYQSKPAYPFIVHGAGAGSGLSIILQINNTYVDYLCTGFVSGFKVLLHLPGEIPQVSKYFFRVPLQNEVIVMVKPNMMTTNKELIKYKSDK